MENVLDRLSSALVQDGQSLRTAKMEAAQALRPQAYETVHPGSKGHPEGTRNEELGHTRAARARTDSECSRLSTGIEPLDLLLQGGIAKGALTEITGPPSSGRTSVLLSILAEAIRCGERAAYVDAFNSLDPDFAEQVGIDLRRLLWVRCGSAEKALKAADILVRAGGFGILALDLGAPRGPLPRIPFHGWFRLRRGLEKTATALVVLTREALAGSASLVVISLQRRQAHWGSKLFQGISIQAQLLRGKNHGHATFHCSLQP